MTANTSDPAIETHHKLSELRTLLHQEPSAKLGRRIMAMLDGWPEERGLDTAIDYASNHFEQWPTEFCRPLGSWLTDMRKGAWKPQWSAIKTLPVRYRTWPIEQITQLLEQPNISVRHLDVHCDLRSRQGRTWCRKISKILPTSTISELSVSFERTLHNTKRGKLLDDTHSPKYNGAFELAKALPNMRALHLNNCHIKGGDIVRALGKLQLELTSLGLAGNALEDKGIHALLGSGLLDRLKALDISRTGLGETAMRDLMRSVELEQLQELNLDGNGFGRPGMRMVAKSPHLHNLRKLDVQRTQPAKRKPWLHIIAQAHWFPGLTMLNGYGTGAQDQGVAALMDSDSPCALSDLNLSSNPITDVGVRAIANSARALNLKRLSLDSNTITNTSLGIILRSPKLAGLEHLELGVQPINIPDYARMLSQQYPNVMQLKTLTLGSRAITPELLTMIASAQAFPELRTLQLRGGSLDADSIIGLLESPHLPHIHEFDFDGELPDTETEKLASSPALMRLTRLSLGRKLGAKSMLAIARSPYCANLQQLELGAAALTKTMVQALARNPHLGGLYLLGLRSFKHNKIPLNALYHSKTLRAEVRNAYKPA